jgi:hypothetical protein
MPINADVRLDDLPPVFREVADLIGLDGALALVRWRGGTSIKIPDRPRETHPLAQAIGQEFAQRLAGRFGRGSLNIPTPHGLRQAARNRGIRAEYDAGARVVDLVQKHSLSERSIYTILKEAGR